MRVLRADGRDGSVKLIVYGRLAHLFIFRWGVTLRLRRGSERPYDWRHICVRAEAVRFSKGGASGRASVTVETWMTDGGTALRRKWSKRYVTFKVLA